MRKTLVVAAAAAIGVSLVLAGCTSPSTSAPASSSASSGTGQPTTTIKKVSDLKVALFATGSSNTYLQVEVQAAKDLAKKEGLSLDVYDGQFVAQTQYNQIQSAITSGKYNAFIVEAVDGNLVCKLATQDAPAAGILVATANAPLCNRTAGEGEDLWVPGTTTFVGGQTLTNFKAWVAQVKKKFPNGAKIALIHGNPLSGNSINFESAAKAFTKSEGYEIVGDQATDYSANQAYAAAQTIIAANPDLDVIMSNYSGMSKGVVQATTGTKVKVFDWGGDSWSLDNVKSGVLEGTYMLLPKEELTTALKSLVLTVQGKPVPKFTDLAKTSSLPHGTPFVYKNTVDDYTAEY